MPARSVRRSARVPDFLSFAFPVGSQRVVTWESVVARRRAGLVAACDRGPDPLRDIWATPGRRCGTGERRPLGAHALAMLGGGLACLGATTAILLVAPGSSILAIVALAVAVALLLPLLVLAILAIFDRLQHRVGAVVERASRWSSCARREHAAALDRDRRDGAIAVFGSVTIEGSRANLEAGASTAPRTRGLRGRRSVGAPRRRAMNCWSRPPFPVRQRRPAFARLAGVRAVGLYRSGFLEDGDRRLWVLAPPPTANRPLPSGQLVSGNLALATARLRAGGWAVISQTLAAERGLRIGERFTLPSPRPMSLRVAALSTNFGWPPGAIMLGTADFARAWNSTDLSAYNVMLAPGASARRVAREIKRTLGPASGLTVQTARERERSQQAASHNGLVRLAQIALSVSITGALAMAISMGAVVWQRRERFARMRIQGLPRGTLWLALIWESVLLLGSGCMIGAAFGVYGQLLLSHALLTSTGFPVLFSARIPVAIESFLVVAAVAVITVAILGCRATGVRPDPQS